MKERYGGMADQVSKIQKQVESSSKDGDFNLNAQINNLFTGHENNLHII